MATLDDAIFVQERLGYKFQDLDLLRLALNAAGKGGAEGEEDRPGNSRLAHVGNFLMQFLLAWVGFSNDWSRAGTTSLRTRLGSNSHCAEVAQKVGLDRCLKYDMRSGSKSPGVLRKALNAIIAAVFSDSGDLKAVLGVVLKLGLFAHDECGVDPKLLSNDHAGSIGSFGNISAPTAFNKDLGVDIFEKGPGPMPAEPNSDVVDVNFHQAPGMSMSMPPCPTNVFDFLLDDPSLSLGEEIINGPNGLSLVAGSQPDLMDRDNSIISRTAGRKKARISADSSPYQAMPWLGRYMAEERQRCILHNVPPPEQTFFPEYIEKELRGLGAKHAKTATLVHIMIASPYAIASLRELVISHQSKGSSRFWQVEPTVSPQVRFEIISSLDCNITAYGILRRYHILRLFEDSVPSNSRVLTNFINSSSNHLQATKRPGNPGNNAKADVTSAMMKEIYHGLDPSSPEYKTRHREVSRLQILGRRFHALAARFHQGILGLIPPPGGLTRTNDFDISDCMIRDLSDTAFNNLLDILDRTQGPSLRRSSDVTMRLIGPLISGTPRPPGRFRIEAYTADDIIRLPKGSEELLDILSEVAT
ncbi:hypothetical protein ASPVEDRAFT_148005 [Aspergillus versicolor CBS 583.65]|uniref:RNase III domain-containing protein n=1 Tax=Aspergillus versicolor CBS 583.65 TaxID=1036611 RepID=A0A1L9PBJ0_ASPVE|nr:uncharacterized protein ASPVEDRAFT_148005 [Aspergillus versicolor CBS 583.65]OJI98825.1 hypothetical protein ASPVEDRAFT_148005 [Aspergillus versicolor CBS 583.65]